MTNQDDERAAREWAEKETPKTFIVRSYSDVERLLTHGFLAGLAHGREEMRDGVGQIVEMCDHGIPYYAYGDNEAACEMSSRLSTIQGMLTDLFPAPPTTKTEEV